ncbi:medium-chain acyl-[acyl-carrier-protein] hydrolase [Luteibacter sp. Sphag1AF]|uniref:thioesterase II family protein n=1 Tax=Luteibacter sp. Sphag1AF TaxID=2587031 RepID=UPI00160B9B27|nr:alpha/beta fold hydrolase [Luteibacter sp. Sphag1AF]MBB3228208.1 medium-chain acyl-[acyl-carrier-protein] hydrolase [Luteibacter sp. Sphag1AF]
MKYTNNPETRARWMTIGARRPDARARLFCFPYAGSGASIFRGWQDHLPEDIEVVGVQLPGRENRFNEPRFNRLIDVIAPLHEMVAEMADKPFYFFGHSIGALIAFELSRALQRYNSPQPFHLVVSGMRAPHIKRGGEPLHLMDDDALLERITDYNGTPKELLQDVELMKFFLPQLRDDFAISETYQYRDGESLTCPVTALGGDADPSVSESDLDAWEMQTRSAFRAIVFEGDHFFIHPNKLSVLDVLGKCSVAHRGENRGVVFGC